MDRRVVITGMGLISPMGNTIDQFRQALETRTSAVRQLQRIPTDHLPSPIGGEALQFTGQVDDFGELDKQRKRSIKKGLKLMCREIQMGVAAAQRGLADAGLPNETTDPARIGTMFGCDYIVTEPAEFISGVDQCRNEAGEFDFARWAENGLHKVEPLWLLKYLPNMPASHVAIYNDLRGPSNSLTVRESSANLAVAEATTLIARGTADQMVVGSTGSSIHLMRTLHVSLQHPVVDASHNGYAQAPHTACRPFEKGRSGMVLGEGAGCLVVESLETARQRGASIIAEVVGYASSSASNQKGVADYGQAFENVLEGVLRIAGLKPHEIGHVNAHGIGTLRCDREEAQAIQRVLGDIPVMALKSYMGNLGAGGGLVETIGSILALQRGHLFATLNQEAPDPECPVRVATSDDVPSGDTFINVNMTPQGQASAIAIRRFG